MDTGLSDHRAHNRPMDSQVLRVYWRPGCSSCVKVKEFLSQLGVDYQSINVSATPEAMDELREMGVRTVPVVARGREYVFAQALEDVSRFLGQDLQMKRLAPAALVQKRSEEHTSELQSRLHLVCRLLLEKKKNKTIE